MRNLILTLFLLLGTAVSTAGTPTTQLTETDAIRWDSSLSLPQLDGTPNIGIAGVFSGRIDGKLLIAGGANFPDRTPEANGEKRYHRDLYIYDPSGSWQVIRDALPEPRAYGISVTLPEGVLCIGGCNVSDCTDQVLLLTLDGNQPRFTPWPSLPRPLANAAGALIGHRIYVAGGIEQVEEAATTRNFFMLDLHDRGRGWQELPPWPGPARAFAVAASQSGSTTVSTFSAAATFRAIQLGPFIKTATVTTRVSKVGTGSKENFRSWPEQQRHSAPTTFC